MPPALLAFVVSTRARNKVPLREQLLSCGAALGNLLNAAHQLGYGAIMLSGERCFDAELVRQIGIATGEQLAGFITIGTIAEPPPATKTVLPGQVWSCWMPGGDQASSTGSADMQANGERATEPLFAYGTLQSDVVQLATFGRKLDGHADLLHGFRLDLTEVSDASVVKTSGRTHHPIIWHTGVSDDRVEGTVFAVTPTELAKPDAYEVSDYRRDRVLLASCVSRGATSTRAYLHHRTGRSFELRALRYVLRYIAIRRCCAAASTSTFRITCEPNPVAPLCRHLRTCLFHAGVPCGRRTQGHPGAKRAPGTRLRGPR